LNVEAPIRPKTLKGNAQEMKPTRSEAEEAVRTLLKWAGDDPDREGLLDTPARVARAYQQWFRGYDEDPSELLKRTFEEVEGYDEMVVHHMAPIIGVAHVGYIPTDRVVGISKLARIVDAFAKRLQVQEKMNAQIANILYGEFRTNPSTRKEFLTIIGNPTNRAS